MYTEEVIFMNKAYKVLFFFFINLVYTCYRVRGNYMHSRPCTFVSNCRCIVPSHHIKIIIFNRLFPFPFTRCNLDCTMLFFLIIASHLLKYVSRVRFFLYEPALGKVDQSDNLSLRVGKRDIRSGQGRRKVGKGRAE